MQIQTSLAYAVSTDKTAKHSTEQCRDQQPSNLHTRTDMLAQQNLDLTNDTIFFITKLKIIPEATV
jgi:hypothetical protein